MKVFLVIAIAAGIAGFINLNNHQDKQEAQQATKNVVNLNMESPKRKDKVIHTDEEWKKLLTPDQYKILRHAGTERAFCGVNLEFKGEGEYRCVGCDLPLFRATTKFDSGSGWPSFYDPIDKDNVWYRTDKEFGMVRTEILCSRCDGHLGHVFDDGPPPTNLRFCINGTVLKFVPKKSD